VRRAVGIDGVDEEEGAREERRRERLPAQLRFALQPHVVAQVLGATGHELDRRLPSQPDHELGGHELLDGIAIEVRAEEVMRLGGGEGQPERPVEERDGEVVIDADPGPRRARLPGEEFGEFGHPALAGGLERAPARRVPVDRLGNLPPRFLAEAFPAMRTEADGRPEGHVEEDAVKGVVPEDFRDLPACEGAIVRVVRTAMSVAGAGEGAFGGDGVARRHHPPAGVLEPGPVVEDDAVVGADGHATLTQRGHLLADRVVPAQPGMHPPGAGRPVAETDVGLAVDHDRRQPGVGVELRHRPRVEFRQEGGIPVGNVHVDQHPPITVLESRFDGAGRPARGFRRLRHCAFSACGLSGLSAAKCLSMTMGSDGDGFTTVTPARAVASLTKNSSWVSWP